jgi:hypothetical protein
VHCRDTVKKLTNCPDVGCPSTHHPNLNSAKNRTDAASSPAQMTVAEIIALQVDPAWGEDEPAASMQAAGEGKAAVVEGYLAHVAAEKGESCNCYLSGEANNDFHLNLVSTLAESKLDSTTARWKSIVVEMTPRVRKNHSGWSTANLGEVRLHHRRVRVTGWLMLDTAHVIDHHGGARASLWEVHPITAMDVKVGGQWVNLDNYQP